MARGRIKIEIKEVGKVDSILSAMPIQLREKALVKALRAAGNIVAKEARRLAPKPGYKGDKPGLIPLNKSIKTVVRRYNHVIAVFVGPTYPQGAHGHLVEYGHAKVLWGKRTGEQVKGKPFMRPAADTTEAAQQAKIISVLRSEVEKLA